MSGQVVLLGLILLRVMVCECLQFLDSPASLTSMEGTGTRLPCQFRLQGEEQVVQVTWSRMRPGGAEEHIIMAHITEGTKEFPGFVDHVQFENVTPLHDCTLLIRNSKESDEAKYTCHISTFPSGNFEKRIQLTVWMVPIASVEPVTLTEGNTFQVAATCRAVGRPKPQVAWDTDVPGQSQAKTIEGGKVILTFSVHPLRNMNGRPLDCLVSHPALKEPKRVRNNLNVQYPPNAVITGYSEEWHVGKTGAGLRCEGGGNPKAQHFTWTRDGGALPSGASAEGPRLVFKWPLNLTDSGLYECVATNVVGSSKTEVAVVLPGTAKAGSPAAIFGDNQMFVIVGVVAGALVVVMVIVVFVVRHHHRRKNRRLKRALSQKTIEMDNLSRHASIRRLNSAQSEHYGLRPESVMQKSLASLDGSVLTGEWTVDGRPDSVSRPGIYPVSRSERGSRRNGQMDMKTRQKVEAYLRNSQASMDSGLHRDQSPPSLSLSSGIVRDGEMEGLTVEGCRQRADTMEEEEEETDGALNRNQLKKVMSSHFQNRNGTMELKPRPHDIVLHPKGYVI
ncbi:nectin-4 [Chanos chanos]|uniref:Nectin-4 n=1 Tax=Chanos chanos TaxID=29144 RepID=A0A6J2VJJ6_CHACN|nr:nectin-4 [Chanos chanos]